MLLLYVPCVGIVSSRKIERACFKDLALRVLTANQQPDHSRISDSRRSNLDIFKDLFIQILRLCQKAISHEWILRAGKASATARASWAVICSLNCVVFWNVCGASVRPAGE